MAKRRRRVFKRQTNTRTRREVVSVCDFAIDLEASDRDAYKATGDEAHLRYHEDERPMRFKVRALTSSEFSNAQTAAYREAETERPEGLVLSQHALGLAMSRQLFMLGVEEVSNVPIGNEKGVDTFETLDSKQAIELFPVDFVADIARWVKEITQPDRTVEVADDVGKSLRRVPSLDSKSSTAAG